MAILDLQRRLAEAGRIRLGATEEISGGRKRPKKLEAWRLTSADRSRIEAVAALYGGKVEPWDRQWQVFTDATELPIMLIPGQELSAWWEMWGSPSSGGAVSCLRRCDGFRDVLSDGNCLCPADYDERRELAAKGKACKPTTRLSVLLAQVEGVGSWRLESHGFNAAVELAGSAHILATATAQGVLLPARLRLEQRESRKAGQLRKFPVPVISVDGITPLDMLAIASGGSSSAASLPVAASAPPLAIAKQSEPEPEPEPTISAADRRRLFASAKAAGLDEAALRALILARTGSESTAIPVSLFQPLMDEIRDTKGRTA